MKSVLIATLMGKDYPNHWMSELRPLLETDKIAGHRDLCWYGQKWEFDEMYVGENTCVVLKDPNAPKATIIGTVVQREVLSPQQNGTPSRNKLLVEVWKHPVRIEKTDRDPYVHKTVCDSLGIPFRNGVARGIYYG